MRTYAPRGRRRGSAATEAGRRWPAGRSGSSRRAPSTAALRRSSRGDGRTVVLPTSASRRGRRRGSAATGAGRRWPAGRSFDARVAPKSRTAGAASELARRRADRVARSARALPPRTSSRVRGHGSGPSVACRPTEPWRTGGQVGAREATGGPPDYGRLLRRAADVVAGPRPRERAVGGLQAVLRAAAPPARLTDKRTREATGGPR